LINTMYNIKLTVFCKDKTACILFMEAVIILNWQCTCYPNIFISGGTCKVKVFMNNALIPNGYNAWSMHLLHTTCQLHEESSKFVLLLLFLASLALPFYLAR
jgi:hypothetical protein